MDPKAFVAGMSALGAGMAMIAGLGPGIAMAESTGIYALVIALILLFANPFVGQF